jgi:hypothetical protein
MIRLLNLSEALGNLADNGTDTEVQRAMELCSAFMERIKQDRLAPGNPSIVFQERVPNVHSRFVN